MSVKVMGQVWDTQGLTSSEKLVLLAYADHASHDGTGIWPAVMTVVRKTSLSERTVQRVTRGLEEKGYLVNDGQHDSGTNLWKIPVQGGGDTMTPPGVTPCQEGVTLTTERGDTMTPEPFLTVINHKEKLKNIKNIGGAGFYIFSLVDYDYAEVDTGTRNMIDQLITVHGEDKLCLMADEYVEQDPGIGLRPLLGKINDNASGFPMPALEKEGEIGY